MQTETESARAAQNKILRNSTKQSWLPETDQKLIKIVRQMEAVEI